MRPRRFLVFVILFLVGGPARADQRWTFFEMHVGGTAQGIDGDFREAFGPSLLAGLRTGAFYRPPDQQRIGWEVTADFTLFDYQLVEDADVYRLRVLGGARMERPFAGDARLIYRLLGGIDYIIASVADRSFGIREESGSLGPVIEPGAGVVWQFGQVLVGANATLPLSYHRDTDAGDDTADFDYIGVELDLLFTVGASL